MNAGEYEQLIWDETTIGRYWRWQARYPEQYFTYLFGDRIAYGLRRYIESGRRVLDYGCGMGFLSRHLTAFGADVWATDLSPEAVASTNNRNRGVPGFRGAKSLDQVSGAGEKFDRILSIEVVEHLDDRKLIDFFTRMRELLDKDGLVVVTTPNEENLQASEIYCPRCDHVYHRWQHMRSFSAKSLSEKMVENGLDVVETFTTDFARKGFRGALASIKTNVKRIMGKEAKLPHLVCVARART